MVVCCCTVKRLLMKCNPSTVTQVTGYQLRVTAGAARGLLGSRHLVVKINEFTDFHPILRVSTIFEKIRALFYTQTPTGTAPAKEHVILHDWLDTHAPHALSTGYCRPLGGGGGRLIFANVA